MFVCSEPALYRIDYICAFLAVNKFGQILYWESVLSSELPHLADESVRGHNAWLRPRWSVGTEGPMLCTGFDLGGMPPNWAVGGSGCSFSRVEVAG